MGPAVWAEVGEGMAASTAAEVMPMREDGGEDPYPGCGCCAPTPAATRRRPSSSLRISEVAGLRVADIDLAAAY